MRLRQIQSALPEVQSIWIFGPTGHPQVITRDYPAPYAEDFGALDYFVMPRDGPGRRLYRRHPPIGLRRKTLLHLQPGAP